MKVYISCPWSFSNGLEKVARYLMGSSKGSIESVSYNKKGEDYNFSLLEQADCVVFVLDVFRWQERLESISRGMLTELVWCLNNRKPIYLAYKSASTDIGIYSAQITEELLLQGIAGTSGSIFKVSEIKSPAFGSKWDGQGTIIAKDVTAAYFKPENSSINYQLEETPKTKNNYFY